MAPVSRAQSGFTLIEVLIATAVLSIAMTGLIAAGAQYADYANYLQDKTVAQWVAHNQLATVQLHPERIDGKQDQGHVRMAGRRWTWTQNSEVSPDPRMWRVTVGVSRQQGTSGAPGAQGLDDSGDTLVEQSLLVPRRDNAGMEVRR